MILQVANQLNRLTKIKSQSGQAIAQYTYDALSRRTQLDCLNNTQAVYNYDPGNRLLSQVNKKTGGADISRFSYTYDNVANRLSMATTLGSHLYTYDNIYQLKRADYPSGYTFSDTEYSYDLLGNRASTSSGSQVNYSSNNLNQYTEVGTDVLNYDASGNLINDGVFSYTYDSENRLIQAVKSGTTAVYKYDPLGRRIKKEATINSEQSAVNYIYDGDQIIAEYNASGNLIAKFIYGVGIDEVLKGSSSLEPSLPEWYYSYDGLGSVSNITDSQGNVVKSYAYDTFGLPDAASAMENTFMFTGREHDAETGLYFYRARYYNPKVGRFMQRDPLGYGSGVNLYSYCGNNAVNAVDPMGLYTLVIHGWGYHDKGYSGDIGSVLGSKGETVKEVLWSGNPFESSITTKIKNEIVQASAIAKARGEKLNIITHSWGGVLASSVLRNTNTRVDNFIIMGTPYFNFSRPTGVIRYANIIGEEDFIGAASLLNFTAKQFEIENRSGNGLFYFHDYWNEPDVIKIILEMLELNQEGELCKK